MPTSPLDNLESQMAEMKSDMREMRASMGKIADAMSKLAVLEERNQTTSAVLVKLSDKIDRVEQSQQRDASLRELVARNVQRIEVVEKKTEVNEIERIKFTATTDGIAKTMRFMWGAFGAGIVYIGTEAVKFFSK